MTLKHDKKAVWTLDQWSEPVQIWDDLALDLDYYAECVLMAKFGMAHSTIARFTGLSKGQVKYRLKLRRVRVSDFRMGVGPYAEMVFKGLARRAALRITHEFRQLK